MTRRVLDTFTPAAAGVPPGPIQPAQPRPAVRNGCTGASSARSTL
mgnify:CR=1 FL=1